MLVVADGLVPALVNLASSVAVAVHGPEHSVTSLASPERAGQGWFQVGLPYLTLGPWLTLVQSLSLSLPSPN